MRIVAASFVLFALAGTAAAQTPPPTPELLTQVYACSAIEDAQARLACYDGAVGQLRAAEGAGQIVAVDRLRAEELEREAFGFSLPSLPRLFSRSESTPELETTHLEIARVSRRPDGYVTVTMTNGQVWSQIDGRAPRTIREGASVTIRRAAFGSFLLAADAGGAAIRVRRTQ